MASMVKSIEPEEPAWWACRYKLARSSACLTESIAAEASCLQAASANLHASRRWGGRGLNRCAIHLSQPM